MKNFLFVFIFLLLWFSFLPSETNAKYQEGDTLHFWSVSYIDWPPLWGIPQHDIKAVCKKAGDHCYVFVEVSAVQPSQLSIDNMVSTFDNNFYHQLIEKYGPAPDEFDNDSSIFILAMSEPNWAGYFDPANQMAESFVFSQWGRHSNQREIIYITADYFESSAQGIVAHEFGHLLHWKQDHSPDPIISPSIYWETAFVDEGFSTFAALYLTENIFQHGVPDYSAYFATEPDIPLIYFTNYDQAELFMLFMFEHYGGWNYISSLIGNQLNGQFGVDSTLHDLGYQEHFDDVFEQFCIANYADDSVFQYGKYGYSHYNFPDCKLQKSHTSFPVPQETTDISPYGADYILFRSMSPKPVKIDFKGDSNSSFRLAFILLNPSNNSIYDIRFITLDSNNSGVFMADSLGTTYKKAIMVVMNTDGSIADSDKIEYSYLASELSGCEEYYSISKLQVFPNPASDFITILDDSGEYTFDIINIAGVEVISNQKVIDGKPIIIKDLKKGLYFIKLNTAKGIKYAKFIKN
jgi:hypothetical protein